MKKGFIQVYTGNGKGKTTAALGLCFRAHFAGLKASVVQFLKSQEYSEIKGLRSLGIPVYQYGTGCFIEKEPSEEDFNQAKAGWQKVQDLLSQEREIDLLVLDELNIALYYKLLDLKDVIQVLEGKPEGIELVITGRYAEEGLIELADLVTEMNEIKHYYSRGVLSRLGIEH